MTIKKKPTWIVNYDINDYKEKTDLDSSKLFTSTYAALRSYGDILTVEQSREMLDRYRQGLERVIDSSANLFELRSLKKFASGLLVQLGSLLKIDRDTLLVRCHGWTVAEANGSLDILAATGFMDDGNFEHDYQNTDSINLPDDVLEALNRCHKNKANIIEGDRFVGYFPTKGGFVNLLYLDGIQNADEIDSKLIEIFCSNVTIAFDNLYLDRELYETQGEIIETLGDVVETRSKETANHVKRVAHLSRLLAEESGLSSEECDTVFMAAPMHDIGKVAIPDSILLKPGGFEPDEWEVMKTHAKIGQDIFEKSKRPVLQAAAVIAGQHHEKFDGSGYPNGLSGKNIHIYGRIVAITDVFDALIHKRCYKEAWPLDKVIELFNDQKGSHFDPELVDLFFAKIEEVKQIVATYPDRD